MDTARSRLELANDNAAAFWLAQARLNGWEYVRQPHFTAVRCDRGAADAHRVVVTRPYPDPVALRAELLAVLRDWDTIGLCLEDPYGRLDLSDCGGEGALEQAVMSREPEAEAAPGRRPAPGLAVAEVRDPERLADLERTVVDGFPMVARMPWSRGELLPEGLLGVPGFRAWLAELDGQPAGGCVTFDDGPAVGVYWVATLPQHRSRGVARAAVAAALAAHDGRIATLVATLLGEPLYRRLGFTQQGLTRWWRHAEVPGVTGPLGARDTGPTR